MSRRTVFTTVTPLPVGVTRQIALDFLHDHHEMIDLNPLIKERHPIPPPPHAPADERRCQWYSLTDKVSYFPGVAGDVTYTCAFNDVPTGLQTHCYAPAGLTIRAKWSVGGTLPGEPSQPHELGLRAPATGLYLREDVDMRCNMLITGFAKRTLKKSHAALVERLKMKAAMAGTAAGKGMGFGAVGTMSGNSYRNSTGTMASPPPTQLNFLKYGPVQQHPSYTSPPTSPPPPASVSASVSTISAVSAPVTRSSSVSSSPSSYSPQSSPVWSQAPSTLGTSPAMSTTSSSPAIQEKGEMRLQRKPTPPVELHSNPAFDSPQPSPQQQEQQQQQQQQPPISVPVPEVIIREPDTPFLRPSQLNWPLANAPDVPPVPTLVPASVSTPIPIPPVTEPNETPTQTHTALWDLQREVQDHLELHIQQQQQEQQQEQQTRPGLSSQPSWPLKAPEPQPNANWPLKPFTLPTATITPSSPTETTTIPRKPRPQSQLYIKPYRPPAHHAAAAPPTRSEPDAKTEESKLSDDALWLALGGAAGSRAKGRAVSMYGAGSLPPAAAAPAGSFVQGLKPYQPPRNVRASSYGAAYGVAYGSQYGSGSESNPRYGRGHPDYPQMSPYDGEVAGEGKDSRAGSPQGQPEGSGVVGLGVDVGRGGHVRTVSMPPMLGGH